MPPTASQHVPPPRRGGNIDYSIHLRLVWQLIIVLWPPPRRVQQLLLNVFRFLQLTVLRAMGGGPCLLVVGAFVFINTSYLLHCRRRATLRYSAVIEGARAVLGKYFSVLRLILRMAGIAALTWNGRAVVVLLFAVPTVLTG